MKNKIAVLSFALALIVAIALPAFGQTIVPTTTLSTAVTTTGGTTVVVASATNITANNTYLYVDGEYMAVNAVNSTTLTVTRGYNSTRAATHKSGALVWNGPSTYFQWASPIGYPSGSCTRTGNILPWIDVNNSIISDCLGGVWVNGVNAPLPSAVTLNAYTGGTIYTSIDSTGTTLAATTMYCSEVNLPYNRYLTGIGILNGTSVATDKHLVALYDSAGNLVANSAVAGTTSLGSASEYGGIAFTAKYFAVGPAQYFACLQTNGTTATVRMMQTQVNDTYLTKGVTGITFGTIPATFTVPTTFTTEVGPYVYLY